MVRITSFLLFTGASSLYLNGQYNTLFAWTPPIELNTYTTDIFIRFKTTQQSNVILFIEDSANKGYMFLELHGHSLYFHYKARGKDYKP